MIVPCDKKSVQSRISSYFTPLTTLLKQAKRFAPEQRHAAMDKAGLEALVETAFDYDPRRHGEYWASAKPYIEEAIVNAARIA